VVKFSLKAMEKHIEENLDVKHTVMVILLVIIDQVSKLLIHLYKPFVDWNFFAITFVKNTGALWGSFKDSNLTFIWISILAIGLLIYLYDQIPHKGINFYYLILAGIIGNFADRVFRGFVVDFLNFKLWPVFNFADAFIVIGVIGLIYFLWNDKPDEKKSKK